MNWLAGAQLKRDGCLARELGLEAEDAESLLVAFLSELVYAQEKERLAFDKFKLRVTKRRLAGLMEGCPLQVLSKPIKAVTYHNLLIRQSARGYQVDLVFDV